MNFNYFEVKLNCKNIDDYYKREIYMNKYYIL